MHKEANELIQQTKKTTLHWIYINYYTAIATEQTREQALLPQTLVILQVLESIQDKSGDITLAVS